MVSALGFFPSLHLHFVAPAKCCHPKSPTNLPPYGGKATAVAWWSSMAPSASAGHTLGEEGWALFHSIPSTFFIQILSPRVLQRGPPLCSSPPEEEEKKILLIILRVKSPPALGFMNSCCSHSNQRQLVFQEGNRVG